MIEVATLMDSEGQHAALTHTLRRHVKLASESGDKLAGRKAHTGKVS